MFINYVIQLRVRRGTHFCDIGLSNSSIYACWGGGWRVNFKPNLHDIICCVFQLANACCSWHSQAEILLFSFCFSAFSAKIIWKWSLSEIVGNFLSFWDCHPKEKDDKFSPPPGLEPGSPATTSQCATNEHCWPPNQHKLSRKKLCCLRLDGWV